MEHRIQLICSVILQGHTLRLLSLPDFLDASIGKILKVLPAVVLFLTENGGCILLRRARGTADW